MTTPRSIGSTVPPSRVVEGSARARRRGVAPNDAKAPVPTDEEAKTGKVPGLVRTLREPGIT